MRPDGTLADRRRVGRRAAPSRPPPRRPRARVRARAVDLGDRRRRAARGVPRSRPPRLRGPRPRAGPRATVEQGRRRPRGAPPRRGHLDDRLTPRSAAVEEDLELDQRGGDPLRLPPGVRSPSARPARLTSVRRRRRTSAVPSVVAATITPRASPGSSRRSASPEASSTSTVREAVRIRRPSASASEPEVRTGPWSASRREGEPLERRERARLGVAAGSPLAEQCGEQPLDRRGDLLGLGRPVHPASTAIAARLPLRVVGVTNTAMAVRDRRCGRREDERDHVGALGRNARPGVCLRGEDRRRRPGLRRRRPRAHHPC